MDLAIKEITNFVENDIQKTKLIISENNEETEIILTGSGKLKVAAEV